MEFARKFMSGGNLEQEQKMSSFMLSQVFIQIVNLGQLLRAIGDFIGTGKLMKSEVILDVLKLCIESMVKQMTHERMDFEAGEKRLREQLSHLGVSVGEVRVKSLYPRLVKLQLTLTDVSSDLMSGKLGALFENILGEPVKLSVRKISGKRIKMDVVSSREFKLSHSVAYVGKGGSDISGDSYFYESFPDGRAMLAISDGMGNGEVAKKESSEALKIVKCLIGFGIPVGKAIQVVWELKQNSNVEERFFTLDLCLVDKEKQKATFFKQGATTTFIVRGEKVIRVNLSGLPIGVARDEFQIDQVTVSLEPDDVIVMTSDGITDEFINIQNLEAYLIHNTSESPKKMAHNLLDYTISRSRGCINDDMMALVAQYGRVNSLR